ncbi:hypothetical protein VPH35_118866 [Triticum aestivum]|uniref:Uncharacterized protein n=2 Tax=Aegilops tauschii TaxID=37682 RepID=A0A453PX41_AEGTS
MEGIEMIDVENPDRGGNDMGEAQPDRRLFRAWREGFERIVMPHDDMPNPADEPVEAAEPTQCSRHAFLCFAILAVLIVAAASAALWFICLDLHPTTFVGRAFLVIARTVSMICFLIIVPLGEILVLGFIDEALRGNPPGCRSIDLFI